ncbi:MAG: pirin family protein [Bacteroidota bacterium]
MDNLKVKNIKQLGFQWETSDPFLFCVHHKDFYPKGNDNMGPDASLEGRHIGQDFIVKDGWRMYHGTTVPGFPGHPHRGFETVTVVRKGIIDHSDSLGASGRYGNGDVQWMTAGKGVQHAEMFPLINQHEDNPLELFQIWLNLPKANKFVEPHYSMIWKEAIPIYTHEDSSGKKTIVDMIAGGLSHKKAVPPPPDSWASDIKNEVAIWVIKMEAGAKWDIPLATEGVNRTLYFYQGEKLKVDEIILENNHSAEIKADADIQLESIGEDSYVLILQGKPINEPVVQNGPFVMNTRQEIQQAYSDYRETAFGGWPWPVYGPVHAREKGRFASHSDGRMETPEKI